MATPAGNQLAVGAREGWVFELNTNGYPAATSTDVYEGIQMIGIKAADLTIPDPRVITHPGNDRNLANDFLPSLEAITGEIRIANLGMPLNAKLASVKQYTVGEMAMMSWGTDQQGSEIDMGFLIFQQSLDTASKLRRWRTIVAPKARGIPILAGMNENAAEQRVKVISNPTTKHIWGTAYAEATEGCLEACFDEGMATYKPKLVAWEGNAIEDTFLFPVAYPAADILKVEVWVDGVLAAPTVSTTQLLFGAAPADGAIIVALYEFA